MNKEDLILECTCSSCPEQYDVCIESETNPIGYIRFRYGRLTCYPCDKEGNILWHEGPLVQWDSISPISELPEKIRPLILDSCKEAIASYYTIKDNLANADFIMKTLSL